MRCWVCLLCGLSVMRSLPNSFLNGEDLFMTVNTEWTDIRSRDARIKWSWQQLGVISHHWVTRCFRSLVSTVGGEVKVIILEWTHSLHFWKWKDMDQGETQVWISWVNKCFQTNSPPCLVFRMCISHSIHDLPFPVGSWRKCNFLFCCLYLVNHHFLYFSVCQAVH